MIKPEVLQAFNIQISLILVLVVFVFRSIFSGAVLKVWKTITRATYEVKDHPFYKTLGWIFVYCAIRFSIHILPLSTKVLTKWSVLSKVLIILFITKFLTVIVRKDSRIMQKTIATSKNETVNTFVCKILRGIIWICSIFIIIRELGYDLTGLAAGLGIRQCYHITSCSRYSKEFTKWCCNFYR